MLDTVDDQLVQRILKAPLAFQSHFTQNGIFLSDKKIEEIKVTLQNILKIDKIDLELLQIKLFELMKTLLASTSSYLMINAITKEIGEKYYPGYHFALNMMLALGILSHSALHRINEKHHKKLMIEAIEGLAIMLFYQSSYGATRWLLKDSIFSDYELAVSLGTSTIIMPSALSLSVKKLQDYIVKRLLLKGAQRSDTTMISSGLTHISNTFFQINYFLYEEVKQLARLFQLILISDNILTNPHPYTASIFKLLAHTIHQMRNVPAFLVDIGPSIYKNLLLQNMNLKKDYHYNSKKQKVLHFIDGHAFFDFVPRHQLRTNDLVCCDAYFDLNQAPLSGELICLKKNKNDKYQIIEQKYRVNFKNLNGEDHWLESTTATQFGQFEAMDLHALQKGEQIGVLKGTKIDLYQNNDFLIRIKKEKEQLPNKAYEKKAIINDIINRCKRNTVYYAFIASTFTAAYLSEGGLINFLDYFKTSLFTLFQLMIPFSETPLRTLVNNRIMEDLNKNLVSMPMNTIDALRIVDLCHAVRNYYVDLFPKNVVFLTDKTGTLTTSTMEAHGFWTANTQAMHRENYLLPNEEDQIQKCFEVFLSAYTNNSKTVEPEEDAILHMFKNIFKDRLQIEIISLHANQFQKNIYLDDAKKTFNTLHLGLYPNLGGRFTLLLEEGKKYLIFCGIPKESQFKETSLFHTYSLMGERQGVLSRDWCVARATMSDELFLQIKNFFLADDKKAIEKLLCSSLSDLDHYGTFIIDNPLKKGAKYFIEQCYQATNQIPVLIITGDTAHAAKNIAKVLYPSSVAQSVITIRNDQKNIIDSKLLDSHATIIFAGINQEILMLFKKLMKREGCKRPAIIFAEMSAREKGLISDYLKANKFYVIANGDGANDVEMMKNAHVVFAHLNEEGKYAPGVAQYADLNDLQMQQLFQSSQSFYELFDIYNINSQFIRQYAPLRDSQEKPFMALSLKGIKMSFDAAKLLIDSEVKEMPLQHWATMLFDIIWFYLSYQEIVDSTDYPIDARNIGSSYFPETATILTMAASFLEAYLCYQLLQESTNLGFIVPTLLILPFILKSVFKGSFNDLSENANLKVENELKFSQQTATARKNKLPEKSFERRKQKVFHHHQKITFFQTKSTMLLNESITETYEYAPH